MAHRTQFTKALALTKTICIWSALREIQFILALALTNTVWFTVKETQFIMAPMLVEDNGYKPDKVLCCMFLFSCFGSDNKHNSCLLHTEELTKKNLLVM